MKTIKIIFILFAIAFSISQTSFAGSVKYDKGLNFKSDDGHYSLTANVIIQPRFQYNLNTNGQDDSQTLRLRRARLKFQGHALVPDLKYYFQANFAGSTGGPTATLDDALIDYEWKEFLQFKVGQMKIHFDREFLISSSKFQFTERSVAYSAFSPNRDMVFDVLGSLNNKFYYHAFVFNGEGANTTNLNAEMPVGMRLTYNVLGDYHCELYDFKTPDQPSLAFSVAGIYDPGNFNLNDDHLARLTADVSFLYKGFSFLGVGHFLRNLTDKVNDYGFLTQVGYMIVPKHFEVALRGAGVIRSTLGAMNDGPVDTYETTVGLNYFLKEHWIKIQTDYSILWNHNRVQNQHNHRFVAQFLFIF